MGRPGDEGAGLSADDISGGPEAVKGTVRGNAEWVLTRPAGALEWPVERRELTAPASSRVDRAAGMRSSAVRAVGGQERAAEALTGRAGFFLRREWRWME